MSTATTHHKDKPSYAITGFVFTWLAVVLACAYWIEPDFWKDGYTYYTEAQKLAQKQRFGQAAVEMQEALLKDPENTGYWVYLGSLHEKTHDPENALVAYRKALSLDPDRTEALLGAANLELAQGDTRAAAAFLARLPEDRLGEQQRFRRARLLASAQMPKPALADLKHLLETSPGSTVYQREAASAYMALKAFAEAEPLLAQLSQADLSPPEKQWATEQRAIALRALNQPGQARDLFARAANDGNLHARAELALELEDYPAAAQLYRLLVDRNPQNPQFKENLAYALDRSSLTDDNGATAEKHYQALIAAGDATDTTRIRYAWLLMRQQRYPEAWDVAAQLEPRPENPEVTELRASAAFLSARYQVAVVELEQLLEKRPDKAAHWKDLADAYDALAQPRKAARALQRYTSLLGSDAAARFKLAMLWDRTGRKADAERLLAELSTADGVDSKVLMALAAIQEQEGKHASAAITLEKVWRGQPAPDPRIAWRIARLYDWDRQASRAAQWYRETLKAGLPMDQQQQARLELADLYESQGKLAEAARVVAEAANTQPGTDPGLSLRLGRLYHWQKQYALSEKWYQKALTGQPQKGREEALVELTGVLIDAGRAQAALDLMDDHPGILETRAELQRYRARAAMDLNQPQMAVTALEKLSHMRPLSLEEQRWLAGQSRIGGDSRLAQSTYESITRKASVAHAGDHEALGDMRFDQGDFSAAYESYLQIPEADRSEAVLLKMARAADKSGLASQALKLYTQYASLRPNDVDHQLETARFMINAGQFDLAMPLYAKVVDVRGTQGLRLELARANLAAQRFEEAEKWSREAVESKEAGWRAILALAQALHLQGASLEADEILRNHIEEIQAHVEGKKWLGYLAVARDRHTEAFLIFDELVKSVETADKGHLWLWRGIAATRMGDYARARESFQMARNFNTGPLALTQ